MSKTSITLIQIFIFLVTSLLSLYLGANEMSLLASMTFVLGIIAASYFPAFIRNRANGSLTNNALMVLIFSALIASPVAGYGLVLFINGRFFMAIVCLYLAWAVGALISFFFGIKHGVFYEEK